MVRDEFEKTVKRCNGGRGSAVTPLTLVLLGGRNHKTNAAPNLLAPHIPWRGSGTYSWAGIASY